jgi:Ser/Thr protein kinase RdoA (MazF antagonist)
VDLFRFDPPDLAEAEVRRIAQEWYGVDGELLHLRGERSHNTRITTADGSQYVLRVASASEPPDGIEFNALAMVHLEQRAPELPIARVIPSVAGQLVPAVRIGELEHLTRLETFLPGVTFDDHQIVSLAGMQAIGSLLGGVAAALADFDHPAADGFMPWDIANGLALDPALHDALPPDARALVDAALPRLRAAANAMERLPRQIIHNDGHAGNLLRAGEHSDHVTGLIDFGDSVRTVTVADIAIAGASLAPHHSDPTGALAALANGYHRHRPLTDDEVSAIPDLVLTRLALSTLMIQYQLTNAPHLIEAVTPEREWTHANLLRWLAIDAADAARRIQEER